jgi:hypothetical protein
MGGEALVTKLRKLNTGGVVWPAAVIAARKVQLLRVLKV